MKYFSSTNLDIHNSGDSFSQLIERESRLYGHGIISHNEFRQAVGMHISNHTTNMVNHTVGNYVCGALQENFNL